MKVKKPNPFDECPVYETQHFIFKRVCEDDAEDLFICYTDSITLKHMNNDNCPGEWRPEASDELKHAWQRDYENRTFLRWSIHEKSVGKVIGTIEIAPLPWGQWFFGEEPPVGILRIDLLSMYEKEEVFSEIISLMSTELSDDFEVNKIIMKAPPDEPARFNALISNGFYPDINKECKYDHYYIRVNHTV